ncbi:dihydrofolate reductase family protein [Pseudonocardia cypriaca]|uniref:Riboflavin biosynthesis pyrimidine reductase n=1 Tax=Pseudonocardia cypriaca TaxID=882449 RepID=A0A543FVK2_9PSEU|nr:dihydrofolate reductase family protein [Pseudonocardia cypriaca]TQM37843.1 riboflavin biosynthesis pyrimidine reductase [Pseudonocardia cypriaca]
MRRIWPPQDAGELDDEQLEQLYGYPASRWLCVNFVASADGAVSLHGRARELSNEPDQRVLRLGSDLADVLLVGATTAMVEEFRGVHPDDETAARRARHGLAPIPPTAVVTTGRSLPEDAPVVTEAVVPTFVITTEAAPERKRAAWAAAGATVVVAGEREVDLRLAVDTLAGHGLRRVDSEGGAQLFGALLAAGVVDELRLTVSPTLVSGVAGRIATGVEIEPARLELLSVVAESDTLMVRYGVRR